MKRIIIPLLILISLPLFSSNPDYKLYPINFVYYNPAFSSEFPTVSVSGLYLFQRSTDLFGVSINFDYRQRLWHDKFIAGTDVSSVNFNLHDPSFFFGYNIIVNDHQLWAVAVRASFGMDPNIIPAVEVATFYQFQSFYIGSGIKYQYFPSDDKRIYLKDQYSSHLLAGANINLTDELIFSPSAIMVWDEHYLYGVHRGFVTINGTFTYKDRIRFGSSYLTDEVYKTNFMAGYNFNKWQINFNFYPSTSPDFSPALEGGVVHQFRKS